MKPSSVIIDLAAARQLCFEQDQREIIEINQV
jgi:hypothetical protein